MAPREEVEEAHHSNSRLFTDGLDDILDHCDCENGAPNMGPISYSGNFKSEEKRLEKSCTKLTDRHIVRH